jgi:hypothetical protein
MASRFLALLAAGSVVGGPLAIQICEVTCAGQVGMTGSSTASTHHPQHSWDTTTLHHHHHDNEAPVTPTSDHASLSMARHECNELAGVVAESRTSNRASVTAVEATSTAVARLSLALAISLAPLDSRHGPLHSVGSVTLRI